MPENLLEFEIELLRNWVGESCLILERERAGKALEIQAWDSSYIIANMTEHAQSAMCGSESSLKMRELLLKSCLLSFSSNHRYQLISIFSQICCKNATTTACSSRALRVPTKCLSPCPYKEGGRRFFAVAGDAALSPIDYCLHQLCSLLPHVYKSSIASQTSDHQHCTKLKPTIWKIKGKC